MGTGLALLIGGIVSAIIAGGVSVYNTNKANKEQTELQNKLLEKQNDFSLDMWNKTNEYNQPSSELDRLMNAGMSRGGALQALSGGNANIISSSSAPTPAYNFNPLAEIMGNGINSAFQNAANVKNMQNTEADTRLKNAEANSKEQMLYYDMKLAEANWHKIQADLDLTTEETIQARTLNKYLDKKSQAEIDNLIESYKLTRQQTALVSQQTAEKEWENFFRTEFGMDPHDDFTKQMIQACLKGKEGAVFNAVEKSINVVWEKLKDTLTNVTMDTRKAIEENVKSAMTGITKKPIFFGLSKYGFNKGPIGFLNLCNMYHWAKNRYKN